MARQPNRTLIAQSDAPLRRAALTAAGVLLVLGIWQVVAVLTERIAVATPWRTLLALSEMASTPDFYTHLWISVQRMLASMVLAGAAGLGLGIIAGLSRDVRQLLEPLRWTVMSIPPVTVLVIAMLWLGLGSGMVISVAAVLLSPIIYVNTVKGMELVDRNLLEMAHLYRFGVWLRVRHIYVPALTAPLLAGMVQVVCSGVRVVVLAEVMGAYEGMGAALQTASTHLEIPTLFAWVFLCVAIVAVFEYLLLRPIQRRMLRWRQP